MKSVFAFILSVGLCGAVDSQAVDIAKDKYQYFKPVLGAVISISQH